MGMKRLGTWLGIAAIALQIALPLVAGALPRAVTLVPLCTVDGVTHYLEVPTGKTPLDGSAHHGDHCPLCCLGHGAPPLAEARSLAAFAGGLERPVPRLQRFAPWTVVHARDARAPPSGLPTD